VVFVLVLRFGFGRFAARRDGSLQRARDISDIGEDGDFGAVQFAADGAVGLEAAEDVVGLGPGAVHGSLGFFGSFVDHAATAKAPGGSDDFEGEGIFEGAFGG
jgi:hypothetical protein